MTKATIWLLVILLGQYITEHKIITSINKGKYQLNSQLRHKVGFLVSQCCRYLVKNFRKKKNKKEELSYRYYEQW